MLSVCSTYTYVIAGDALLSSGSVVDVIVKVDFRNRMACPFLVVFEVLCSVRCYRSDLHVAVEASIVDVECLLVALCAFTHRKR